MSKILDLFKDIKFLIGIISTLMIVLSAFRYEVIHHDDDNDGDANYYQESVNVTTLDKTILDALSKFDRNVRHLLIKGKEASKYDFMKVLPDFREAIERATQLLNELQKLNLNTNYGCKDSRKADRGKGDRGSNSDKPKYQKHKKSAHNRTLSFSFRFGSRTYQISLYWPRLLRLFLQDDVD